MSTEAWLRGPVPGVPGLLMPVAHALVQAREDLRAAAADLTREQLWLRPASAASVGFHLRHIPGAIDRLLTYVHGRALTDAQLAAGRAEVERSEASAAELLDGVDDAVERVLGELEGFAETELLAAREVGRARLPSTVIGLLFHIAEHTQRHAGQVIVTAKVVRAADG